MKNLLIALPLCLLTFLANATEDSISVNIDSEALMSYLAFQDSLDAALQYETGTINLGSGLAQLIVPAGYKYLGAEQTEFLMSEVYGNPPEPSLGMLVHKSFNLVSDESFYMVELTYVEDGFVDDEDASDIDYDDLLEEMQDDAKETNASRIAEGYEPIELIGWATPPFYDKASKKLHWAQELQFGDFEEHTLNYNIRILGRKGYIMMNAIGGMEHLPKVQEDIDDILGSVHFTEGNRYADFNPDIDKVAAYGIGGLVAGKLLAKAGFFALIAKFWKFIAIGAVALFAGVKKFFGKGE